MNGNSSFSKIFLIFVWLMLRVGSAFGSECASDYAAPQENPAWDGSSKEEACTKNGFYIIDNAAKLAWFSGFVNQNKNNSAKANAKLMADLDMGGELWTPICAGTGGNKDGKTYCQYQGTFDGNGHVIKNLYINGDGLAQKDKNFAQNLGFIGVLGGGTVKDLILENVDIHATTNAGKVIASTDQQISVGSFVGWMSEKGTSVVEKCMVTGSIRTTGNGQGVGGIVGNAKKGTISDCLSLVEIMTSGSKAYVGGIIGITKIDVTVKSCVYGGPGLVNIGTNGSVGGIAGNVFSGTLTTNNDYYEINNYYEGNEINGVGQNCDTCKVTSNNTEKVDISNKEEIACKLNGGKYNDATCDKTGAWSIGETTLSLFDYGVDGYKIYFYANGGKFADGTEAKYKFLDVGMTITPEDIEYPSHDDKTFIGWSLKRDATEPAENLGTVSESDTVFAVWQDKLTVTFNVSPGVFPDENIAMKTKKMDKGAVVTVGSLGTLPTSYCKTPSSTGDGCDELLYFTGWAEKVDPVESDTIHLEDFYATDDVMLYAVWTDVETYTVTYNANGHGKTRVDYVRVGKGKMITVPVDPVAHDGYEFVGWFTEASCDNPFDFTTKIHENIILYAKWKPINYKITYEVGEGSANADNPNEYNVESETINLKAPTSATGYSFDDWFTDDAFSKKVTKIAKGSTGDKSFYAKWSTKTYRITYLADNNSYGSVSDQIKEHGSLITLLSSGIFKRNGYEQDGWATEANGAKVYDLGASYRNNADLTLFPSWKIINYTIEYVCDGCINDPQNPTEYTIFTSSGIKYASGVPEGYKFGGWFKEKSYKNKVTKIEAGTTGNIKLYGKLNEIYNITYKGTDDPYSATTYTVDDSVKLNKPKVREGYVFDGWFNKKDFTGDEIEKIAMGSKGDTTFYAKWTNEENGNVLEYHTITYVVGEDTVATDVFNAGDSVTLADLPKNGYELDGWYVDKGMSGDKVTGFAAGATDDKIFYAKIKSSDTSGVVIIKYTATYDLNDGSMGNESFTFTVESGDITLPTPTRNGYTFVGWLDSKTKTVITTLPNGSIGDRTLTAQWVATKYTITYNNLEGATNTNPTTYTIESNKIKLSGAERNGYTFEGWFDSEDHQVTEIPAGSTGDVILTAKWSDPIEYKITYNLNDGVLPDTVSNPTKYSILTPVTTLYKPTKKNYDFVGWFTADDIKYEEISGVMTGNLELTARWKASSYSITYKIGESVENLRPNKYTVENAVTLAVPTKDGYTFDGWYENDGLIGTAVTDFAAGTYSGDQTFYAKWVKDTYTITYDIDGNNVVLSPNEYTVDDAVTLPAPTKAGYIFEAWQESGTSYVRTSLPEGSVGDRSFIALWSDPIEYKITYDLKDGTLPEGESNPTTYTVESDDITLVNPTKKGYDFEGWFDSENNQVTEIKRGSTGDLNLTAKWSAKSYVITYVIDGENANLTPNGFTVEDAVILPTPTKDGYSFDGWYEKEKMTGAKVTGFSAGTYFDAQTFYGQWIPEKYTITYDAGANGSGEVPPEEKTHGENLSLSIEVFKREGYTQDGWSNVDGGEKTYDLGGTYSNNEQTTLYPHWTINTYTITYMTTNGASQFNVDSYTVEDVAGDKVIDLNPATRCGFDFEGWFKDENFSGDAITQIKNGDAEDLTLYPKWVKITNSVEDYGAVKIYVDKNGLKCAAMDGYSKETVDISEDVEVSYVTFDREFTVNKTADDKKLATIVLPFTIAKNNVVGAEFFIMYKVNPEKGVYITPVEDDYIYANTPYIVRATKANLTFNIGKDETVKLNTSEIKNATSGEWELRGMYSYKKWDTGDGELGNAYGYTVKSSNEHAAGSFARNAAGAYIYPFRAYLYQSKAKLAAPSPFLAKSTMTRASVDELSETSSLDVFIVDESVVKSDENVEKGGTTAIITVKTAPSRMKARDGWYDMKGRKLNAKPTAKGIYYYNGKKIRIQ